MQERRILSNNIVPAELIPATATTTVDTSKRIKNLYIPLTNKYDQYIFLIYKMSNGTVLSNSYASNYNSYWNYGITGQTSATNWIPTNAAGSGCYSWSIMSSALSSNDYYITLSSNNGTSASGRLGMCPVSNSNSLVNAKYANGMSECEITNDGSYYVKINFEKMYSEITAVYKSNTSTKSVFYGPYINVSTLYATDGTNQTLYPYFEYVD